MTLLELLRQELPKRGGWPEGVREISTHASGRVFFDGRFAPQGFILPRASDAWNKHEHPYSYTNAVTREQYEAALAAKNDGWIEWGGGKHPPVSTNTVVDVKFKNGNVQSGYPAGEYSWEHEWAYSNIIAYRLHKPQEAEQAKADDEADLNECARQDAAPAWSGEGLPPIGCFCEVEDLDGMLVYGQGESGEVIFHVENTAVIRMSYGLGCFEARFLRPLRTEAEHAIDEMVRLSGVSIGAAKILYDAGYRKG